MKTDNLFRRVVGAGLQLVLPEVVFITEQQMHTYSQYNFCPGCNSELGCKKAYGMFKDGVWTPTEH